MAMAFAIFVTILIVVVAPVGGGDGRAHVRSAAGETWSDPTLAQWPEKDFRLFVGNLAKDLKLNQLEQAFLRKSRGYGFVSVLDPKAVRAPYGRWTRAGSAAAPSRSS